MGNIVKTSILILMSTFIAMAPSGAYYAETPRVEEVKQAAVEQMELNISSPVIIEEVAVDVKSEPKPEYYVEVENNYISEDSIRSICEYVGANYDISPNILQAIAFVESRYKVNATSCCNAKGLCQIIEKWNMDRITKLGITDVYDPYSSVLLCADLISTLKGYEYGDDIQYVLMAYNLGATGAKKLYEAGNISGYAKKVLNKVSELEQQYGKGVIYE